MFGVLFLLMFGLLLGGVGCRVSGLLLLLFLLLLLSSGNGVDGGVKYSSLSSLV